MTELAKLKLILDHCKSLSQQFQFIAVLDRSSSWSQQFQITEIQDHNNSRSQQFQITYFQMTAIPCQNNSRSQKLKITAVLGHRNSRSQQFQMTATLYHINTRPGACVFLRAASLYEIRFEKSKSCPTTNRSTSSHTICRLACRIICDVSETSSYIWVHSNWQYCRLNLRRI